MKLMLYINFNGNIHKETEPLLPVTNRAFKYGDSFFESMMMFNKRVPLLEFHWERLTYTAETLGATLPRRFDKEKFQEMLLDLAAVNECSNARLRLELYRKGEGNYLPTHDELGFCIQMQPVTHSSFETGTGLNLGIYPEPKPASHLSFIKSGSALYYVMAAKWNEQNGFDESLICNAGYDEEKHELTDYVSEAINGNVMMVKGDVISYVPDEDFPVAGVMQLSLLELFDTELNFSETPFHVNDLLTADEIWVVNAVKGIQWVKTFKSKSYQNKRAVEITALLNDKLSKAVSF